MVLDVLAYLRLVPWLVLVVVLIPATVGFRTYLVLRVLGASTRRD